MVTTKLKKIIIIFSEVQMVKLSEKNKLFDIEKY